MTRATDSELTVKLGKFRDSNGNIFSGIGGHPASRNYFLLLKGPVSKRSIILLFDEGSRPRKRYLTAQLGLQFRALTGLIRKVLVSSEKAYAVGSLVDCSRDQTGLPNGRSIVEYITKHWGCQQERQLHNAHL